MQDASDPSATKMIGDSSRLFQEAPRSPDYRRERMSYLRSRLRYLVAVEGENNHHKVREFLEEHRELASGLISDRGTIVDAPGRLFKERSSYAYLFWAGSDLCEILDTFTDEATKTRLHSECYQIETEGLTFQFNDETIVGSRHFDMQPLIEAAFDYDHAAKALIMAKKNRNSADWAKIKPLWLKFGKELGKVPLWIAQLYCSKLSFCPPTASYGLEFEKTILFQNLATGEFESWYENGYANPLLGTFLAIQKIDGDRAWGLTNPPSDALERGCSDLDMLGKMYKKHIRKQPQLILKKLAGEETEVIEQIGLSLN